MGSKQRKKAREAEAAREEVARAARLEKFKARNAKAVAAYELYETNPVFRHLVDCARQVKYTMENKPLTRAIQMAEAVARQKAAAQTPEPELETA